MSQSHAIFRTLKQTLRQKKITYQMIAEHLQLSESTIKRLFAGQDLTIERLEKICHFAGLEISDLVHAMESSRDFINELNQSQEKELASDPKLLLVTFLVLNGLSYNDIMNHYRLSSLELTRYLIRLERMRLVDLYPNNKIRIRISPSFKWQSNGPIQRFFVNHLLNDFIDSSFSEPLHAFHLLSGLLSTESVKRLRAQLQQLAIEFNECILEDAAIPYDQRAIYSLVLAMRDWQPTLFTPMRK